MDQFDDPLDLDHVQRFVRLLARHPHGSGGAFHQLTGDADDGAAGTDTSLAFRFVERLVAVLDHGANVRHRASLHVAEPLVRPAHAHDLHFAFGYPADQRFHVFGTDIKSHQIPRTVGCRFGRVHAVHRGGFQSLELIKHMRLILAQRPP